jgi:hypothetical protein
MKTAFSRPRVVLVIVSSLFIIIITWPGLTQANGGTILLVEEVGVYELTLTASSYPLQVGVNDINALVERLPDQLLVLDAQVIMIVEPLDQPGETQTFPATHDTATNKLYYHANVIFPAAGRWKLTIKVNGPEGSVSTTFEARVESGQSVGFLKYLSLMGLPLVVIAFLFFVLSRRVRKTFNNNSEDKNNDASA